MDGLLLVRKPQGCTSHDVVDRIRKIFHIRKAGHFGTLDPMATGLILIGIGQATRLFPFLSKADKEYRGNIFLGYSTDTYDAEGNPISSPITDYPKTSVVLEGLRQFEGEINQTIPPFSAKKHRGKPLYAIARANESIPKKTARIYVHYFRLLDYSPPNIQFEVKCSSGTYIRSLAHELGRFFGCGAHLNSLERTAINGYSIADSRSLDELETEFKSGQILHFLIPISKLLPQFPKVHLSETECILVRNGSDVPLSSSRESIPKTLPENPDQILRLFDRDDNLLAYAKKNPETDSYHPFMVFKE